MDIRQLRYFACIVECGSFSKAAEQLYIAQPSLSQQMQILESELKTQLLLRGSQGVRPTDAGKILYRHARGMLRSIENIHQELKHGASSETGTVSVGLPTTVAAVLAHPLFVRVRERFPGIHLHILDTMSGYLAELVANGRLDMSMMFRDTPTGGVAVEPLFEENLYLVGGSGMPADGQADTCPLAWLGRVPMVLPSRLNGLRLYIERSFASAGVDLNVVADIDSLPTRMAIVRDGYGCTILSDLNLLIDGIGDIGTVRRLVEPALCRTVSLCWPTSLPQSAASTAVYGCIIDLVNEMASRKSTKLRLFPRDHSARNTTQPSL